MKNACVSQFYSSSPTTGRLLAHLRMSLASHAIRLGPRTLACGNCSDRQSRHSDVLLRLNTWQTCLAFKNNSSGVFLSFVVVSFVFMLRTMACIVRIGG